MSGFIEIRGARQHNLADIDVDLPRSKLVVLSGPSGSGKSSLAFDTIYAEGQRRYVESLSAHARQFLERLPRPDVDTIEGLSPAVAIGQQGLSKNPRSTVATITEVHDYLRLLFARVGQPHCPGCDQPLLSHTVPEMVNRVSALPERSKLVLLAPLSCPAGAEAALFEQLRKEGFSRVEVDSAALDLHDEVTLEPGEHRIELVVDRLLLKPGARGRLAESLELAAKVGKGRLRVRRLAGAAGEDELLAFSEQLYCEACDLSLPELTPALFSFNSPAGACSACGGLGGLLDFDPEAVADPALSLREGALKPWAERNAAFRQQQLEELAKAAGFDLDTPWGELAEETQELLLHGSGERAFRFSFDKQGKKKAYDKAFEGVLPNLERRRSELERRRREGDDEGVFEQLVDELEAYMVRRTCPSCRGARLSPPALAVRVGDMNIAQLLSLPVRDALAFVEELELARRSWGPAHAEIAEKLLRELEGRLAFLEGVGVGYLGLERRASTLSGGEAQRVRLATQIGSSLVGVLYILDEPTMGLHPRDTAQLLTTLQGLRDRGNTVLVVEHDEATIRAADHLVDLGPGAGVEGGHIVSQGSVAEVESDERSPTGAYLSGRRQVSAGGERRGPSERSLRLRGARAHNLRSLDVEIPLSRLVCVTGVSGSGKSSLVVDTLLPALRQHLGATKGRGLAKLEVLEGADELEKVIAIDQSPIGRSPRSNPASYAGILPLIRDLFAGLAESRMRGWKAGRFSFNVKGGRCEACKGDGRIRVAMHFLPDVFVTCEVCGGRRYNDETLAVRYRGLSIAEVLAMSVRDAREFFANVPRVREKLDTLLSVGLGYLVLGQPSNTLSGGEAQRLKLAKELSRRAPERTLYVLDEPTTGLHFSDVEQLLAVLQQLVHGGASVLVVEHDVDVIAAADWVIDLGPDGGDGGGALVGAGTPEDIAALPGSRTGRYLVQALRRRGESGGTP